MRYCCLFYLFLATSAIGYAQNLSFTSPIHILPEAATDRGLAIAHFKGAYFVAWKTAGNTGNINAAYLGKHQDTAFTQATFTIGNAVTASAPVLQALNGRLYLLWIGANGSLQYVLNNTDTSFDAQNIYTAPLSGGILMMGCTATALRGQLLLAAHGNDKNSLVYALLTPENNGVFIAATLSAIPGAKAADQPFAASLTDMDARVCYRSSKGQVYYADFNSHTGAWAAPVAVEDATAGAAPVLYPIENGRRLCFLWKGYKNDNRIYYATAANGSAPAPKQVLPPYFTTPYPVNSCEVDGNNFIMVYTGPDQRLYLSYFAGYDPATWMQDLLYPARQELTLKDIVIPGSHDAGMSVLNGTGGQMKDAINSCNTLTQR